MSAAEKQQQYDNLAFLSYSRRDVKLARQLQRDLESYRLPSRLPFRRDILPDGKHIRPVFRDLEDMDVRSDPFWQQIEATLDCSRYLIVVCSPTAAASRSVDREICRFLASRPNALDQLLPIAHEGDIAALHGPLQCLPASLHQYREKIAARLLPATAQLSRRELRLHTISFLIGVKFNVLDARHRRRQRWRWGLGGAVLLALVSILGNAEWRVNRAAQQVIAAKWKTDTANQRADREAVAAARDDYYGTIREAAQALEQHDIAAAQRALQSCVPQQRGWEWGFLAHQADQSVAQFACAPRALAPVASDPEGKLLAICGSDRCLRVFRIADRTELRCTAPAPADLTAVAWSPDGRLLAAATDTGTSTIFDAATGESVATHTVPVKWRSVARQVQFSVDGERLFVAHSAGAVYQINTVTGQQTGVSMGTVNPTRRFVIDEEKQRLAAIDEDGRRLHIFALATQELLWVRTPKGGRRMTDFAFSRDGRRLLLGTDGEGALLLDAANGQPVATVGADDSRIQRTTFSASGAEIGLGLADGTAQLFQYFPTVDRLRQIKSVQAHSTRLSVLVAEASRYLVSASDDRRIRVWREFDGAAVATFQGHTAAVRGVLSFRKAWTAEEEAGSIASWADDGTVRVWSLRRTMVATGITENDELEAMSRGEVPAISNISPDGEVRVIRSARSSSSAMLGSVSGQKIATLSHAASIGSVAFAKEAAMVITGSLDGVAKVWSSRDGKQLHEFPDHPDRIRAVALSPDGGCVATGCKATVRIWPTTSTVVPLSIEIGGANICCLQFAPDGKRLATADEAGTVLLWDLATGQQWASMRGHQAQVASIEFSGDGNRLLSSSRDKTARLWDTASGKQVALLQCDSPLVDASLGADGKRAITISGLAEFGIWDLESETRIVGLRLGMARAVSGRFLNDGRRVVVTSGQAEELILPSAKW